MLDLAELARNFMETAKENLRRDGHLVPFAQVLAPGRAYNVGLLFDDPDSKQRAYKKVVKLAKRTRALAVVTVNDIRYKNIGYAPDIATAVRLSNYQQGDLAREGAAEAIFVAVKSPSSEMWGLVCKYTRTGNDFAFAPVEEKQGWVSGLLKDW